MTTWLGSDHMLGAVQMGYSLANCSFKARRYSRLTIYCTLGRRSTSLAAGRLHHLIRSFLARPSTAGLESRCSSQSEPVGDLAR